MGVVPIGVVPIGVVPVGVVPVGVVPVGVVPGTGDFGVRDTGSDRVPATVFVNN